MPKSVATLGSCHPPNPGVAAVCVSLRPPGRAGPGGPRIKCPAAEGGSGGPPPPPPCCGRAVDQWSPPGREHAPCDRSARKGAQAGSAAHDRQDAPARAAFLPRKRATRGPPACCHRRQRRAGANGTESVMFARRGRPCAAVARSATRPLGKATHESNQQRTNPTTPSARRRTNPTSRGPLQ